MGGCRAEAADEELTDDVMALRIVDGKGVTAVVDSVAMAIGTAAMVSAAREGIRWSYDTANVVYVAVRSSPRLALRVLYPVRLRAASVVARVGRIVVLTIDMLGPAIAPWPPP